MTVLVVIFYVACSWLILAAVRDMRRDRRGRWHTPMWERDMRHRQVQREVDESAPIVWRR